MKRPPCHRGAYTGTKRTRLILVTIARDAMGSLRRVAPWNHSLGMARSAL